VTLYKKEYERGKGVVKEGREGARKGKVIETDLGLFRCRRWVGLLLVVVALCGLRG
jgi:hypothetical protein